MRHFVVAFALLALPALADPPTANFGTPLSAGEFDGYATGKTLTYASGGTVWGSEQYLPGHRVLWAFTGQPCESGQWFAQNDAICFVYENNPGPNCWHFYHGPAGLIAAFIGQGGNVLSEVGQSAVPMQCPGPDVGT